MGRKDLPGLVLGDSIPACAGNLIILGDNGARRKITGEGQPFIKNESDAIVAVPRRGDDLSGEIQGCKKLPTLGEFQCDIIVR